MKSLVTLLLILISLSWASQGRAEVTVVASSSFVSTKAAACKGDECKECKSCCECCKCGPVYKCDSECCKGKPAKQSKISPVKSASQPAAPKMLTAKQAADMGLVLYRDNSGSYYYAKPQVKSQVSSGFRGRRSSGPQCSGPTCSTCR